MNRQQYLDQCAEETQHVLMDLKTVLQYVRDDQNRRTGVVLAFKGEDDNVYFGWSKCHSKKDKFNREIGIAQAFRRAKSRHEVETDKMMPCVLDTLNIVADRAQHYFKDVAVV